MFSDNRVNSSLKRPAFCASTMVCRYERFFFLKRERAYICFLRSHLFADRILDSVASECAVDEATYKPRVTRKPVLMRTEKIQLLSSQSTAGTQATLPDTGEAPDIHTHPPSSPTSVVLISESFDPQPSHPLAVPSSSGARVDSPGKNETVDVVAPSANAGFSLRVSSRPYARALLQAVARDSRQPQANVNPVKVNISRLARVPSTNAVAVPPANLSVHEKSAPMRLHSTANGHVAHQRKLSDPLLLFEEVDSRVSSTKPSGLMKTGSSRAQMIVQRSQLSEPKPVEDAGPITGLNLGESLINPKRKISGLLDVTSTTANDVDEACGFRARRPRLDQSARSPTALLLPTSSTQPQLVCAPRNLFKSCSFMVIDIGDERLAGVEDPTNQLLALGAT
jgi:hypothetical protein